MNTTLEQPSVMFRFPVGDMKPGMRPIRLLKKMKHAHVPMIGK